MPQKHTASARLIIGVATLLGAFSTLQAYQFVQLFSEKPQSLTTLAVLNFSFWYGWAALTPIVLWIARRFPLERETWKRSAPVHMIAVLILILLHVALVEWVYVTVPGTGYLGKLTWWERVQRNYFMNFDWEMMTYAAIIAFSHAASYFRQAKDRALRAAHLEARLAEAQLQALQRQLHPHFLFNTLNGISALMHRDVNAADPMLVRLSDLLRMALDRRSAQEYPSATISSSWPSTSKSNRRGSAIGSACDTISIPRRWTRSCRTCCCSRWSRTACGTRLPHSVRAV